MFWKAKRSHSNSYDSVTRKMYLFLANVTNRATSRGRCRFSLEEEGGRRKGGGGGRGRRGWTGWKIQLEMEYKPGYIWSLASNFQTILGNNFCM